MRKQLFVIAAILLFGLITACDATPGNDPFENADSQESFGDESDGIDSEDLGVDEGSTLETCEDPIEFTNEPEGWVGGYMFLIDEDLDLQDEVDRLSDKYAELVVGHVMTTMNMFSGHAPNEVIDAIRCDEAIAKIWYEGPPDQTN